MLFDKPNAELLKLIALCKDVPRSNQFQDTYLFSPVNVERLHSEELVYTSKDGRYYRATLTGYDLLRQSGYSYQPDTLRVCVPHVLTRRENCSQVAITLLLAGVDVFSGILRENTYLPSAAIRREQREQGRNVLSSSRFTGVMGGGYLFYYLSEPQDRLYCKYELRAAENLLSGISAVFYMGADYGTLCSAVTGSAGKGATYRSAYNKFNIPVYLCPCNVDGAIQIRLMLQEDYRAKMIQALYPVRGLAPPEPPFDRCDGMRKGEPVLLGVDMDLRRIKQVTAAARNAGKTAHIFSRPCQTKALMGVIPNEVVSFYNITDDQLRSTFGFSSLIAEPPSEPYITPRGGYIDDQTIRACREARKTRRAKDETLSGSDKG